jgi:hypothetical protein
MGAFKDIYDVGMEALEARMLFRIGLGIKDYPPNICVSITNHTRQSTLYVNRVGIHYGRTDYNYSFTLEPFGQQTIQAKETKDFCLSPIKPVLVSFIQLVKKLPAPGVAFPSFDSPADLFRAIANGNADDSWMEIDFNEFKAKPFKKGLIKRLFQEAHKKGTPNPPKR